MTLLVALSTWQLAQSPRAARASAGGLHLQAQVHAPLRPPALRDPIALVAAPFSWNYRALHRSAAGAPLLHAHAALLVDLDSRRVVYALDPHHRYPMASTAKLMTAMVALDLASPETEVAVLPAATNIEPNHMGLTAGERLSVSELLDGLLLDSGNDAAEALASGFESRTDFIAAMNRKASLMGLLDTHFANPSGLDDPGQHSSAHDLALIAAYLYRNYPLLDQMVATRTLSIHATPAHKEFDPINLNKLIATYTGAVGFKTGLTDDAGYCLVSGAHRGKHTLLAVEMGDPLIFTDASQLLDYGFRQVG